MYNNRCFNDHKNIHLQTKYKRGIHIDMKTKSGLLYELIGTKDKKILNLDAFIKSL